MELWQLQYFVAVAEERSFTRAARRVHVSQQSLSTAIKRLETQLGATLLERTSQRVEPTAAGAALLEAAPAVFAARDAALAAVASTHDTLRGELRLRFGLDCEQLIEEELARFQVIHPGLVLRGALGMDSENIAALARGEADVVFAWVGAPPGARSQRVAGEQALLVVPDRHRLAKFDAVPVAEVHAEPLIMFPRGTAPQVWDLFVAALRQDGRPHDRVQEVPVPAQATMLARVLRGEGVCPMSETLTARLLRPGLVSRPLDPPLVFPLQMVWLRDTTATTRLAQHLAVLGAEGPSLVKGSGE